MTKVSSGAVIWLTGLSGAGKSTIADALMKRLGARAELLDGDALRAVMPAGFSKGDRDAHVRRVGFFASRLAHHGVVVVAALVSPYREARAFARSLTPRFYEVHVATPLATCEARDPKGLYQRARAGAIQGFTGIDDPYEAPLAPELVIDTRDVTPDEAAAHILELVERDGERR